VLTSVHAFATDPRRGIFILAFLAVVIGGSLTLFAVRAPKVGIGGKFDLVSRESMLLGNNVLLLVAAGSVLLGTLYPLFLDALNLSKISVGPPYFDAVFVPLMTPLVFLMGVGPVARWKHASLPELWILLRWALGVAIVAGVLTTLLAGRTSPMLVLGYSLAFWVIATTFVNLRERLSNASGSLLSRVAKQPRGWWGMLIAHLGIAVFIIGVTSVKGFEVERDVRMSPGDSIEVGGYTFLFKGTTNVTGPNYNAARGYFEVSRDGKLLETMRPEKRKYFSSEMLMTDAAISPGVFGDRYVSLGEEAGDSGAWSVRVYSKPFVTWIWFGCIIMALGGFTALTDRRYRLRERSSATVPAGSAPASA